MIEEKQPDSDREYQTRIEAQRVTLEMKTKSTRKLDSGKQPIEQSPLFGGLAQDEMFGEYPD